MNKPKTIVFTSAIVVAVAVFLVGCGGSPDHTDHSDHAHMGVGHSHDHDASAHGDHGAVEMAEGMISEAGGMAIVANPTAEQLAGTNEYPLDTCATSGEKLGDMGEPLLFLVGDQQVKLCCKDCIAELKADPAMVVAEITK